jgi:hypothetical protein
MSYRVEGPQTRYALIGVVREGFSKVRKIRL